MPRPGAQHRHTPLVVAIGIEPRGTALLHYAAHEALEERPGADALRARMAELLLMEALSLYTQATPPNATGLLAGLRDPLVERVLQVLHAAPDRAWSVEKLAADIDSSRSSLASRFREVLQEAPMHYLTRCACSVPRSTWPAAAPAWTK